MVSIYDIKPKFQQLLRPIVRSLARIGITPNQITLTAIILSGLTGAMLYMNHDKPKLLLIVPFVMFIRMALNAIDGMLAKEHQMKTKLGKILNEIGDVLSDALLFLPFALVVPFPSTWIVILVTLSIISEMAGVMGEVIGASRRYDGPMGKSDRAFMFGLIAILVAFQWINTFWLTVILIGMVVLVILNIVIRIKAALKEVS